MEEIGQRQDLWDADVILGAFSLWCKETWRAQLPPVTNIVNCESIGRLWCSQLDVYTSTRLGMVAVALYSEGLDSCALIGVLGAEQH